MTRARLSSGGRLSLPSLWHFDVIEPASGESPFRVRGLAYVTLLQYIDGHAPGGMHAVLDRLSSDPLRAYYDRIFIAAGLYDAAPLLRLMMAVAEIAGRDAGEFIRRRAWASARLDAEGTYKPLLRGASPEELARRSPLAFNRYFDPCRARVEQVSSTHFVGVIDNIPRCMDGLYVFSTEGFVSGCLELTGARDIQLDWVESRQGPAIGGVATETLRFEAGWRT